MAAGQAVAANNDEVAFGVIVRHGERVIARHRSRELVDNVAAAAVEAVCATPVKQVPPKS